MKSLQYIWLRSSALIAGLLAPALAWATAGSFLGTVPSIGSGGTDIRMTVLDIIRSVLNFMALVAVVFVVIAGIRLVVSQGEEAEKDKAKKTIVYVIIGLVIIVLASAIVSFVIDSLSNTPT